MVGGGWMGGGGVGAISLADLFSLSVRGTPHSFTQVHSTSLFFNPRKIKKKRKKKKKKKKRREQAGNETIIRDFCFVLITRFTVYRPL